MNFFTQLASLGQGMDVALRIKGKNGKLTVMVEPQLANNSRLKPLVLTGTPEDLDDGFFGQFDGAISAAKGLESNLAEVKKDAQDLAKTSTAKPEAPPRATAPTKVKKAEKGMKGKKGQAKPKAEKPVPASADMFSQPAEDSSQETSEDATAPADRGEEDAVADESGQDKSETEEGTEIE